MDLAELGKTPIADDSPCGEDIRYDPEFDELQQEIDKLSSPSAAGAADWQSVERIAAELLAHRSKDLLVAAYLAVALVHNRREAGFLLGTGILKDLLLNYWDDLFPPKKRLKGRLSIIEWWHDKMNGLVESLAPLTFDGAEMEKLLAMLDEIDAFLDQHLNNAPAMGVIKRNLERIATVESAPAPNAGKEQKESATNPPPPAENQPQTTAGGEIGNREEARKILSSSLPGIKQAAIFFREKEPENPLGYKLWRAAVWLPISELPPADSDGTTRIPAPPAQTAHPLAEINRSGKWDLLLKSAEARLVQFPFWLDLNYYSHRALTGLGENFHAAATLVGKELDLLLDRLPGLEKLSFADGRPFADPETLNWIKEITNAGPKSSTITATPDHKPEAAGPSGGDSDLCREAEALAQAGNLAEAISLLQRNLATCSSGRERLQLHTGLVEILIQAGKEKLAAALADQTLEMIEQFQLETWDPALAFQGLKSVWQCYSVSREVEKKRKANEIMLRMTRINLVEVMSFIKI